MSDSETVTIHFEVKDNGIGMTPEQIKKNFNPFMQAEPDTSYKFGGTGLGLAITKKLVEMMGGKLLVESVLGVGSKFSFDLKFNTIKMSSANIVNKNKIAVNERERPSFEGEVLLCEDNAMNQQIIAEHFARVGLKTVVANNGKTGLETVQSRMANGEKQFDLIFMDIHMPVMDGLEASSKIFELKTGIPVIAMTANIMTSDREIYRMSGMSDCVGKPFTSQELWLCLMKYLKPVNRHKEDPSRCGQTDNEMSQKLGKYFIKSNSDIFERINNAVNTGDIKLAHRLVHTLKSNAGQLNKTSLQQISGELEDCLKDGENRVTAGQMEIFETELNNVLTELQPLVQVPPQTAAVTTPPGAADHELLDKLKPMLEDGNTECLKFIDALRAIPESGRLIRQIEDFDFELALETLAKLKEGN